MTSLPSLFADVGLARTVVHALLGFGVEYNPLMTQLFDSTALTSACHQWELYHSTFIVGSLGSPNSGNDNLFSTVFTGEQDSFTGQLGYCFVVNEEADVVLTGLGRSINTAIRGGRLQHPHCIRVWDDDSQAIVAQCVVDCDSVVDPAGYRASSLTSPVRLLKGHHYRITSTERAHSGDVWYRPPDGGEMAELLAAVTAAYDTSLVTLTKDCYMPGTENVFPEQSSGNMIPLGIPTFYVSSPVEWNGVCVCSG